MATKDQERKALEQIKKIVEGLGDESYIGKAFEGCFEIAEQNIDNDFWNSMKDNYEREQQVSNKALTKLNDKAEELIEMKKRAERAEKFLIAEKGTSDSWIAKYNEANDMAKQNWYKFREQEDKVEALQQEIIRLKARLFDMMEAQGA